MSEQLAYPPRKKGGGQILICTAGEGWYQEKGKAPVSLTAGTVITIPPEVKHWHGAKKDSWFSHIAVEVPGEDTSNEWCEPVTEKEYCELEEKGQNLYPISGIRFCPCRFYGRILMIVK